jgi:phage portal protein BeeE
MVSFKLMTPNEVRKLEELNPRKDGNELLQMVNMMTEEQMKKQSNEPV